MSSPAIEDFVIDEENVEKFSNHGLTDAQVLQVLEPPYIVVKNRRNRRCLYLVVGRDYSGNCITIPVEKTPERGVWRPVTAWPCKYVELQALTQRS